MQFRNVLFAGHGLLLALVAGDARADQIEKLKDGTVIKRSYYSNGQLWSEKRYRKGKLDGVSKLFRLDGTLMSETTYLRGVKNGPYVSYRRNGNKLDEGQYRGGLKGGRWVSYNERNEKQFEKRYVLGVLYGRRVQYKYATVDGGRKQYVSSVETWAFGIKHGPYYSMSEDEKVQEKGQYRWGKPHGEWVYNDPTGEERERKNYVCGETQGGSSESCDPPELRLPSPKQPDISGGASWKASLQRLLCPMRLGEEAPVKAEVYVGGKKFKCAKPPFRTDDPAEPVIDGGKKG